ncbi:hypothetical protein CPAR01_06646 [Colletotrichum paranaense]|uniref:Uncharacterized protein n=1 Tax=Colletotrichum paranaense TaxID=1914294 RepID=A0ABQ9SMA4_9PEZI|nr:uncharacterized protein CPAR01_06646 [Colletotrichum paranaense]KAK1540657.1 hypothetical protein CPAR01_06646 [Colletotrichum paranaense]
MLACANAWARTAIRISIRPTVIIDRGTLHTTLTWHAQFLLPATRKFKLFLQLYYCMLGFARNRDESAQDNSSSKQQARPFQPTHYPLKSLRKSMAREDGENREMDGDLTERGGGEGKGRDRCQSPTRHIHYPTHARTRLSHPEDRKMEIFPAVQLSDRQCTANFLDFVSSVPLSPLFSFVPLRDCLLTGSERDNAFPLRPSKGPGRVPAMDQMEQQSSSSGIITGIDDGSYPPTVPPLRVHFVNS